MFAIGETNDMDNSATFRFFDINDLLSKLFRFDIPYNIYEPFATKNVLTLLFSGVNIVVNGISFAR
jgi:hypothetical protein